MCIHIIAKCNKLSAAKFHDSAQELRPVEIIDPGKTL